MKPIIYSIIAIVVGIILFFEGKKDKARAAEYTERGVTVPGEVQSGQSSGGRRSRSYNLEVAYATKEGTTHKQTIKVSKSFFKSIGENGIVTQPNVEVTYLPGTPADAIIKDGTPFNPEFQWIGALLGLGSLGFLTYRIKSALK